MDCFLPASGRPPGARHTSKLRNTPQQCTMMVHGEGICFWVHKDEHEH
jgi:hypothetical protein